MTVFYLDPEGGNDANDGTTYANRWKTITNGATAARIAPGDTIRIKASPDPVSVGTATWTSGPRPAAINISSSTNATPIEITTSAVHGLSANDYVSISAHTTNTNANGIWKVGTVNSTTKFTILNLDGTNTVGNGTGGATGNITKANNLMIKFGSTVAKNIVCGGLNEKGAWTASANVTCAKNTTAYKEGYSSVSIDVTASFTTGKAAYWTLPSTLDLSAYQKLSFWVQISAGAVNTGTTEAYLALCTDTTGDTIATTPDHKFYIPLVGATGNWVPVTVDLAANMNSAIKSIAFYVATDKGAQTFLIDNVTAVGSTLNLTSLIGKNTVGEPEWYSIQSLNYDVAMIANSNSNTPVLTNLRGYYGTSESVTTYSRETLKINSSGSVDTSVAPASSDTTICNTINDSGSSGSPITFSGGWNRTDMSTQTGETWWDGQNGKGFLISASKNYIDLSNINILRVNQPYTINTGSTNINITNSKFTSCNYFIQTSTYAFSNIVIKTLYYNNVNGLILNLGVKLADSVVKNNSGGAIAMYHSATVDNTKVFNNGSYGVTFYGQNSYVSNSEISYNNLQGIYSTGSNNKIFNSTTTGNTNAVLVSLGDVYLNNCTLNETTDASIATSVSGKVFCNRLDNTDGNNVIYTGLGVINQQTSVIDSPATTAWKMSPTQTICTDVTPLTLRLATIVCKSNSLVTVTARMRRSNTGLTMKLVCPGGQINGVDTDVSTAMTAVADTWETVTITFTPTKPGGVEIYAYAYGGTTYNGYVSNLTVSQ